MEIKKISKKAISPLAAVIGIIITLLSMYIISVSVFSSQDIIATTAQDKACSSYIQAKDNQGLKLILHLSNIQLKCKKESIEISSQTKDELFTDISDSMLKCWERYGKGESDFMGTFGNDGDWCFVCSKLAFQRSEEIYDYSSNFIPWLNSKGLKLNNGTKTTYGEFINLKYYNSDKKTLDEIEDGIEQIKQLNVDGDPTLIALVNDMSQKNEELITLAQKQIDTNEDLFIVYRYSQVPKETLELIADVSAGIATGIAIETILVWGAGAVITVATGGIAGPAVIAAASAHTAYKAASKAKKIDKLTTAYEKANKILGLSSKAIKFSHKSKSLQIISKFDGSISSALNIGNKLKKINDKFGDNYLKLADSMQKLGIKNVDEVTELITKKQDEFVKLQKQAMDAIDKGLISNPGITKVAKIQDTQLENIDELKKLKESIEKFDQVDKLSEASKKSLGEQTTQAIKLFSKIAAGAIGGTVGGVHNDKNVQYIDVMNREQYYRLCGTEPIYSTN